MKDMPSRAAISKPVIASDFFDDPSAAEQGSEYRTKALPRRLPDDQRPWWKRGVKFLTPAEEWNLATRWRVHGDRSAADKLLRSHLPLVASRAARFPSIKHSEAMAAGCIGLLHALRKFDPARGTFRTYAMSWIDSEIRSAAKSQRSVVALPRGAKPISDSWIEAVAEPSDEAPSPLDELLAKESYEHDKAALSSALKKLNDRERRIFEARNQEEPIKLEQLANELGISRERVRQIEVVAGIKVRTAIVEQANRVELKRAWRATPASDGLDTQRRYRSLIDQGFSPELASAYANEPPPPEQQRLHRKNIWRRHKLALDTVDILANGTFTARPPQRRRAGAAA